VVNKLKSGIVKYLKGVGEMQCGDCEYFVVAFGSPLYGICSKKPKKGGGYDRVMINMDASKCSLYSKSEHIETDSRQSTGSPHFRPSEFGYQERKSDTKVDPNKTKDSKQWG